ARTTPKQARRRVVLHRMALSLARRAHPRLVVEARAGDAPAGQRRILRFRIFSRSARFFSLARTSRLVGPPERRKPRRMVRYHQTMTNPSPTTVKPPLRQTPTAPWTT